MSGFSKIFWGLLFVFLDFHINQFDILPDILGYFIVLLGLNQLASVHDKFHKARIICIVLLILSIPELFRFNLQFTISTVPASVTFLAIAGSIISLLLNLYFIFNICTGIEALAKRFGQPELEERARKRWLYFLWFTVITVVLICFVLLVPFALFVLAIPILIAGLVVFILILMLIRQADHTLPL